MVSKGQSQPQIGAVTLRILRKIVGRPLWHQVLNVTSMFA